MQLGARLGSAGFAITEWPCIVWTYFTPTGPIEELPSNAQFCLTPSLICGWLQVQCARSASAIDSCDFSLSTAPYFNFSQVQRLHDSLGTAINLLGAYNPYEPA